MEQYIVNLHHKAGKYCGQEHTCGNKMKHETECIATTVATKMNNRVPEKKKYDVEPYPCIFCGKWHVGRKMSINELEELARKSGSESQ